jgi:DNA invertase Pin-like site-specific DNA recombinase
MTSGSVVPTAQYLRMSTEHQQYSLENQMAAIEKYAETKGFRVVKTYSDAARSGVVLKRRPGLRQLLRDVVSGAPVFRAILVYDVSRWGRFQDIDESAHYEFLCKSAGVPVHYCAEAFANDGTLPSLIMKVLKRTMAGEYSRELGVKVLEGQKRLARLGFKQGGIPGYGLRRMLVSADRKPKQQLASGERKNIATDRVILVPGPLHELQIIREIYRMLVSEGRTVYAIAQALNRRVVPYIGDSPWNYQAVYTVLTHPKYTGCHVFGRTSCKLSTPTIRLPRSEWVLTPAAFQPVVDHTTFADAQRILHDRTINKTDEKLLETLRALLDREGRLSHSLVRNCTDMPSPSTYRHRFGSLRRAYEMIGYGRPEQFGPNDLRSRTRALRAELMVQIAARFPHEICIVRPGGRSRSRLRLTKGRIVSVLVARSVSTWKQTARWRIDPVRRECKFMTLLARLNQDNESFLDFHVFPNMDRQKRFDIRLDDPWLARGHWFDDLSAFHAEVERIRAIRQAKP